MSTRTRVILGASLLLNLVLLVLLFMSWADGEEPTAAVSISTTSATVVATQPGQPTVTPVPSPTAVVITVVAIATAEPTATATDIMVPTAEPKVTPTVAPTLTTTAAATATASPALVAGPDWLQYTNLFRRQANLPLLAENPEWSEGSRLHSIYMINTGNLWHSEDINSAWYTPAGNEAAANGNLAASGWDGATYRWAIDYWLSATFHAVPVLDPQLATVGFGLHRDASTDLKMVATMDVKRGISESLPSVTYPLSFPRDGGKTWVLQYTLPEIPDPLAHCAGYRQRTPTGPPLILQIGQGEETPAVTNTSLRQGEAELAHCAFDETTYTNSKPGAQEAGRLILEERDAIVIIPRDPLVAGQRYTVTVDVNGNSISWSFEAVSKPE